MDNLLIECKYIEVLKPIAGQPNTPLKKEFAVSLADSIKMDGHFNPIVVRPNVAKPGYYILVQGKHRFYAIKNVLKEQFIRSTVIEMGDEEAKAAAYVENLWRISQSPATKALSVKLWHERWVTKHTEPEADEPKPEAAAHCEQEPEAGAAPVKTAKAGRVEGDFDAQVAAVTGQGTSTVRRAKRIGVAFTPDQFEVFTQMETSEVDMTTIAKIKDERKRAEVVALVASGMEPDDAIKEVMKDEAPTRSNHFDKESKEVKAERAAAKTPAHSDDEWFEQFCGEKAAMLGDTTRYKSDALLYHSITDHRAAFRSQVKKCLAAAKKAGNNGAFWYTVNRLLSISHPKDWLICHICIGKGEVFAEGIPTCKCTKCYGGGYQLKTEEYL